MQVLADGLAFPESPRWHDGAVWFSEKRAGRVRRIAAELETVVEVPGGPGGLGWLPDGRLLVVSMADRQVLCAADGRTDVLADISSLTVGRCNDMVVDAEGRAYVGDFGYDLAAGEAPAPASLVLVTPDGSARRVAGDLEFPNGMVVHGTTLVVAESAANRLTAFDIGTDGSLSGRRAFADLGAVVPDGMCLDAEGAVWVADPLHGEVVRVAEGGRVLDRRSTGEEGAFACALGDSRLFVCTYTEEASMDPSGPPVGRMLAFDVEVPSGDSP